MTLNEAHSLLAKATQPEDVFPEGGNGARKKRYFELAKLVHPDLHKSKASKVKADEAFKLLNEWNLRAQSKPMNRWGDRTWMVPVTLAAKKEVYTLNAHLAAGDLSNVYSGTNSKGEACAIKVCRNPGNNDLLDNERAILDYLWNDAPTKDLKAMAHIVKPVDSFELASAKARKRVVVTQLAKGYYNLASVKQAYHKGLDCRDAAWMFNRVLGALLICQQAGVVHGAVVPEHILIHPDKHNAKLIGWAYAVRGHAPLSAILSARKDFYPPEVFKKGRTGTHTDIYLLAKTMLWLIDPLTLPRNIAGLYKSCLLSAAHRPQNAWDLFKEFGNEMEAAFGPKKFREFKMPA
jgi:serine/threonine protein kinase